VSRYGDPYQRELVEALAEYTGVQPSQIVFGNGADELIDLICRAFVGPGDEVLIPLPIFGTYLMDPVISNAAVRTIAPNEGLEINLGQITEAIGEKTKIITLCNGGIGWVAQNGAGAYFGSGGRGICRICG